MINFGYILIVAVGGLIGRRFVRNRTTVPVDMELAATDPAAPPLSSLAPVPSALFRNSGGTAPRPERMVTDMRDFPRPHSYQDPQGPTTGYVTPEPYRGIPIGPVENPVPYPDLIPTGRIVTPPPPPPDGYESGGYGDGVSGGVYEPPPPPPLVPPPMEDTTS